MLGMYTRKAERQDESRLAQTINGLYDDVARLEDEAEAMRAALINIVNWADNLADGFSLGLYSEANLYDAICEIGEYARHSDFNVWRKTREN